MSWVERQIGDFADVKHGFAFEGQYFADDGGLVLLTPGNCHENGGFRDKGDKEKFYVGPVPEGYLLTEGDLLVVMTDLISRAPVLGGAFFVPASDRYLHNQRLGLVQVTRSEMIDRKFLYYLLNTHSYRGQVRGSASGSTVRHTSPTRIKACRVKIPSGVREQSAIADILSAYDDLIENNRRRIALLEEAARMLYREWFVHFRFPGHEHVKIADGIPDGWERRTLGSVLNLQRGFDLPIGDRIPGGIPVYGSTGIVGEHDTAKVNFPTLITGRSGSLGTVCFVDDPCWPLNTSLWVTEFKAASIYFAYFLLSEMNLAKLNGGASVPTLDRKVAHAANVVIPLPRLTSLFDEQVRVVFAQRKLLEQQNKKLAQARDLLLPRLMTGAIAA
ncbi:restriction endonuclease subunit S [Bradyrhizobium sp. 182]|uniref:restriction endonuclease subunit S n=1 Tax=unclassified Bradyrhizobium TaxID=2631580 RepID=UPI001FF7DF22|nr:restriction endonuclease subunit S [Bradyrhizobium sp. CW12]MCK1527567.1 restriction endonuclease subunit S [Bradyrhizobium sp. 182]MCK1646806.1 restriction endonuclease subunit S [Bradyrhizobium sp. 154]